LLKLHANGELEEMDRWLRENAGAFGVEVEETHNGPGTVGSRPPPPPPHWLLRRSLLMNAVLPVTVVI